MIDWLIDGVTLWTKKHWRLALFVFASVFEVAVDFFHENWFLCTGRNDVTISKTWEFLTPVYLCLLVCNFAVKLAFVPNLLAIVFAIKVSRVSISSTLSFYSILQWKLYHIYKGSWSCRKVIWQVIILSFLLKHISLNCWMLFLRVSSDIDVTIDWEHM